MRLRHRCLYHLCTCLRTCLLLDKLSAKLIVKNSLKQAEQIALTGTSLRDPENFKISPTELVFGTQYVNSDSAPQMVKVEVKKEKAKIDKISFAKDTESENYQFKPGFDLCSKIKELDKGQSCTVGIVFHPKSEKEQIVSTKLIIEYNNGTKEEYKIYLSGTGKQDPGQGTFPTVNPNGIIFSPQKINTESDVKKITIGVKGPNPIKVGHISIIHNNNPSVGGHYNIKTDGCSGKILKSDQTCDVYVNYAPKDQILLSSKINVPATILSMDEKQNLLERSTEVTLSAFSVNSNPICFTERQKVVKLTSNKAREPQIVELTRPGNVPDKIKSVKIIASDGSTVPSTDFTISKEDCTGNSGKTCSLTVNFTPRKEKLRSGVLVVEFESSTDPIKIPVSGIGKPRNVICRIIFKIRNKKLKPC